MGGDEDLLILRRQGWLRSSETAGTCPAEHDLLGN
jgi:hypothetical protein